VPAKLRHQIDARAVALNLAVDSAA